MNNSPWTKEDDQFLIKSITLGRSHSQIAEKLGRTKNAIAWRKSLLKSKGLLEVVSGPKSKGKGFKNLVKETWPDSIKTGQIPVGVGPSNETPFSQEVKVDESIISEVIGLGGMAVRDIAQVYNVQIHTAPGNFKVVGKKENVEAAVDFLKKVIDDQIDTPNIGDVIMGDITEKVEDGYHVRLTPGYRGLLPSKSLDGKQFKVGERVKVEIDGVNFAKSKFILRLADQAEKQGPQIEKALENIGDALVKETGNPLGVAAFFIAMGLDIIYKNLGKK